MDAPGAPALIDVMCPLRAHPASTVLLFDFDGTLAPVVDDPDAATLWPDAFGLLDALAGAYRRVAVLSGRPVAFLARQLPPRVQLSGLYGLEARIDGVTTDHPDAARWRPIVSQVVAQAQAATAPGTELAGALVEPKGLSLTIHTRTHPELASGVERLATALGASSGLEVRSAKRSVELHPPIATDKGAAVQALVADATAALFVGDDVGDLPAFDALAALGSSGGLTAVLVAVGGPELPDAVRRRAQFVLDEPGAVLDLLRALLV